MFPTEVGTGKGPGHSKEGHPEQSRIQGDQEWPEVRLEWWVEPGHRGIETLELHFEDLGGPGRFKQRRDKFKSVLEEDHSDCNRRAENRRGGPIHDNGSNTRPDLSQSELDFDQGCLRVR